MRQKNWRIMLLAWFGLSVAACSLFTFAPPATPTPTITVTNTPTPTITATNTSTPTPFTKDGLWGGGTISDATLSGEIQFNIENNSVTEAGFNYTLRHGGCSEMAIMREPVDQTELQGNEFSARITSEKANRQLIITGTFTSANEASGTLEFKGEMDSCGEFSKSVEWTAQLLPPRPTSTPSATVSQSATQPSPTATGVPATPGGADIPSGWITLTSERFAITVPSSFEVQVPLRDVRLDPGTAQLILLGEDRETGLKILLTETPALFGNAQKKLENRKNDFDYSSETTTILKDQTGITVNGRDAAILEYTRGGLAAVEYYIVVGQEEFDIVIQQGKPNDENFIARAEQIANSFLVDAIAWPAAPTGTTTPSQ